MRADDIKDLVERLRDPDAPFACASALDTLTEDAAMAIESLSLENQRLRLEFRADCEKQAEELFAVQRDAERLDFLINNTGRYRLYQSKKFWWCVPIAAQDWQDGYKSPREAIDAARSQSEEKPA
jgi:hypothetical protein